MNATVAACPKCSAPMARAEGFCTQCGAEIVKPRRGRSQLATELRAKELRNAGRWIFALAVIFALFGTWIGMKTRSDGKTALENLKERDAAEEIDFLDDRITIAELRERIESEMVMSFAVNYLLAATFVGLYFWARKAPLPATVTALCIYLAVQVLNAIVDPATLIQGILFKVFCILGLIAGVRAALSARQAAAA